MRGACDHDDAEPHDQQANGGRQQGPDAAPAPEPAEDERVEDNQKNTEDAFMGVLGIHITKCLSC